MASSKRTTKKKQEPSKGKKPKTAGKKPKAARAPSTERRKVPRSGPKRKKRAPAKGAARAIHVPVLARNLEAAEVEGYMARLPPMLQPMVTRLRAIVLESAPEALEFLEHENPSYFARGVFARIEPTEREVLVRFLRGGSLPSSGELGGIGEERVLKLSSLRELKTEVLQKLVREAVALNLASGAQMPAEA